MKVFVVIVTYNPLKWIRKVLDSLRNSTCPVDIIIIDNGSKDGSTELILKEYTEVDFIQSKENLGFGKANNIGIKKAYDLGAEFVFLLNQDAWIESNTIASLVENANASPEFGIVSPMHLNGQGDALDINFSKHIAPQFCKNLYSDIYFKDIKNKIYETDYVNAAAWLLSRKCIETVGGFNPSFHMYAEDDNYMQRVKFHNIKIGVYPNSVIYHDREQRETPKQLKDKDIIQKRNLILKYSNPLKEFEMDKDISLLNKGMTKALLKMQFELYKENKTKRLQLQSMRDEIYENYTKSRQIGLSFL